MTKVLLEIWAQLRTKYLVSNTLYQALGTKYLVPSTWYQDPGTKYLVPSIWCQVIGTNILENQGGARSAPPEDSSIYIWATSKTVYRLMGQN